MVPFNTFVVFGVERSPEVHLLDARGAKLLEDREVAVRDRKKAVSATFGNGFEYAIPAWSPKAMEVMALEYRGPQAAILSKLCAAIALGKTFSLDGADEDHNPPDGGDRVKAPRPKIPPRGPAGAKATKTKAPPRKLPKLDDSQIAAMRR